MKHRARAAAVAVLVAAGAFIAPAAQAHYDPWKTHWHYGAYGQQTYKMCSWFDATFRGCRNGW